MLARARTHKYHIPSFITVFSKLKQAYYEYLWVEIKTLTFGKATIQTHTLVGENILDELKCYRFHTQRVYFVGEQQQKPTNF